MSALPLWTRTLGYADNSTIHREARTPHDLLPKKSAIPHSYTFFHPFVQLKCVCMFCETGYFMP